MMSDVLRHGRGGGVGENVSILENGLSRLSAPPHITRARARFVKGIEIEAGRRRRCRPRDGMSFRLVISEFDHGVSFGPNRAGDRSAGDTGLFSQCFEIFDQETPLSQQSNIGAHNGLLCPDGLGDNNGHATVSPVVLINDVLLLLSKIKIGIPILGHDGASDSPGAKLATGATRGSLYNWQALATSVCCWKRFS